MPKLTESPALFSPITIGNLSISHRVVHAPMTRMRTNADRTLTTDVKEYYTQRAHTPGTFLVTESVLVAPQAAGFPRMPGFWTDEHVKSWKEVVDAVHAKGSRIALQITGLAGVAAAGYPESQGYTHASASGKSALDPSLTLHALTHSEIKEWVGYYAEAARKGIEEAGFDAIEVHAANGDALEEFLSNLWNDRTDEYGGSAEGRVKFVLEAIEAIVRTVSPERVGVRISPWSPFQNMRMADGDILETYTVLIKELRARVPDLAYLHVIQPRISAAEDTDVGAPGEDDSFVRKLWSSKTYIAAGGFTREMAIKRAADGDLIAFGRWFSSNPDLVEKLREDKVLTPYNRATFYTPGPVGYIDYPIGA